MTSFRDHALDLQVVGFVPLPVIDKRPCVRGFEKWSSMRAGTVKSLIKQFPSADLALLTRPSGLIVLDIDSDDPDLVEWARQEFGFTPLYCKTRRGYHFYYRNPLRISGAIGRQYPVDLKGAGASDYVVFNYEFGQTALDGDLVDLSSSEYHGYLSILKRVPAIDPEGLIVFFPQHQFLIQNPLLVPANDNVGSAQLGNRSSERSNASQGPYKAPTASFEKLNGGVALEGIRNHWLFREALKAAADTTKTVGRDDEAYRHFSDVVERRNEADCKPPLPVKEVAKLIRNVWFNYELKGKNRYHKPLEQRMSQITINPNAITEGLDEPYGTWLLVWLKSLYDQDDTFIINVAGLQQTLGWGRRKVEKARDFLLDNDYIERVAPHNHRAGIAATFKFAAKANDMIIRLGQADEVEANDNLAGVNDNQDETDLGNVCQKI